VTWKSCARPSSRRELAHSQWNQLQRLENEIVRHTSSPTASYRRRTVSISRKAAVDTYFEGFRRSDHGMVLAGLSDDVIWDLPGYKHLSGKQAFDDEIENEAFEGSPTLVIDRLVEEGDTVVAIGNGTGTRRGGAVHHFAFCTVFTFAAHDKIQRVESYIVPLE
jgi:ketosteroid isomerase-like protein